MALALVEIYFFEDLDLKENQKARHHIWRKAHNPALNDSDLPRADKPALIYLN